MSAEPSIDRSSKHPAEAGRGRLTLPTEIRARVMLATEQEAFEAIALAWHFNPKSSEQNQPKSEWRLIVDLDLVENKLNAPERLNFFSSRFKLRRAFTRLMRAQVVERLEGNQFLVTQEGIAALRDLIRGEQDKDTLNFYGVGLYRRSTKGMENALNAYRQEISVVLENAAGRFRNFEVPNE